MRERGPDLLGGISGSLINKEVVTMREAPFSPAPLPETLPDAQNLWHFSRAKQQMADIAQGKSGRAPDAPESAPVAARESMRVPAAVRYNRD